MDPAVFFEVVAPLLEIDRTCLIAVTTILDDENFYSKLVDLKNDRGERLFKCLDFKLGCSRKKCRINPAKCFHNTGLLPSWHSKRAHQRTRALLSGNVQLMLTETMCVVIAFLSYMVHRGIRTSLYDPVFLTSMVKLLKNDSQSVVGRNDILPSPIAFVGVDPNAGGDSNYAIVTAIPYRGELVVRYSLVFVVHLRTTSCCAVV